MRRALTFWLPWLLALTMFAQGIAAAGMLVCGRMSTVATADAAGHDAEHDCHRAAGGAHGTATAESHPGGSLSDTANVAPAVGGDAGAQAGGHRTDSGCADCGLCGLATALPVSTARAPSPLGASAPPAAPQLPRVSFLSEGLERPPRG